MLGQLLEIDDRVSIKIEEDARHWGYNPVPNGTIATVVGFGETYYGRLENRRKKPGVYQNRTWVRLRLPDGTIQSEFDGRLELVEPSAKRVNERRLAAPEEYIRELPDLPLWESDRVAIRGNDDSYWITAVEYLWQPLVCVLSEKLFNGTRMYVNASMLELIERGPVWQHYHGEKLVFSSKTEEDEFRHAVWLD